MEKVIIARLTHGGKQYVGRRKVEMYDNTTDIDAQVIADANVGLTLREQRNIREALKVKNGIKAVSTGSGESINLEEIDEV